MNWLNFLKTSIFDLIFPKHCLGCGREGRYICEKCRRPIFFYNQSLCPFCQKEHYAGRVCPRCREKSELDGVISAVYYGNPIIKKSIWLLKYHFAVSLIDELSEIMALCLKKFCNLLPKEAIIIPVPLFKRKKRMRGFNQAEFFADTAGKILGFEIKKDILIRQRQTRRQVDVLPEARVKNVAGAFLVNNPQNFIQGKKIILVDDIFTTGATLNECAKVLREAGAEEVWGVTLARG